MFKSLIVLILFFSQILLFADTSTLKINENKWKVNDEQSIKDYAFSADGQYLLRIGDQSHVLELLHTSDLSLIKVVPVEGALDANYDIDFVFDASSRKSFIVGIGTRNQLLEVLYEKDPLPVYNGVMHDYRLGEGLVQDKSHFPIRIIKPASKSAIHISSFFYYADKGLMFIARDKTIEVIQLDARQTIATIVLNDIPNFKASWVKNINDTPHLLVPFINKIGATSISMNSWIATEVNGTEK